MGVLDRFEKGIERAVNGAFAKAFRSEVQPVEIASALRREVDDKASIVGRDRTIAPNTFVVELGPADHGRLGQWVDALGGELGAVVTDHARQQRYAFVGPVTVAFEEADDLDTGVFRVRSTTTRPEGHPQPSVVPPAAPGAIGSPLPGLPGIPSPGQAAGQAPTVWSPAPAATPASLEVDGHRYEITGPVTVIGRGADADVVLDDAGASRRHAEVHLLDGKARIIDLGSTNGTFVDGERLPVGVLREGSTITIGRSRIVFHAGSTLGR